MIENYNKIILIACSMIEDEINSVFDHFDVGDIEIRWMERGHHNYPDKLRAVIQSEIDKAEADGADLILLAYGLCGQGAMGWHAENATLVIPKFDDCVNMMLCVGKRDRRNLLDAGCMYLTKGWSKDEGALLSMRDRAIARHGVRKGEKAVRLMFASYTKVSVIDTGCYEVAPVIDYAKRSAEFLGLKSEVCEGSNKVMVKLIIGDWDEDIIVKKPSEIVGEKDFFCDFT